MSGVVGLDALKSALTAYDENVKKAIEAKLPEYAGWMQDELVASMPVSKSERRGSHLRDLLAEDQAKKIITGKGKVTAEVGFVTRDLQKRGYYSIWVERGRKEYRAGEYRRAGKDKRGKQRHQRMKRNIGAMQGRLVFQTAFLRFQDRMKRERALAKITAAVNAVQR